MNATLAGLVLSVGAIISITTIALAPRLCFRPVIRDRMIALLDDFDRHVRRGNLPANDKAVIETRRRMLTSIRASNSMRLLDYLLVSRALDDVPPEPMATPAHLTTEQRRVLRHYQLRIGVLTPYAVFSGSWAGIVYASAKLFHFTWTVMVASFLDRRRVDDTEFAGISPRVTEAAYVTAREQVAARAERQLVPA